MNQNKALLEVKNLRSGYGEVEVVHDVSFSVQQGQIVAILGSNGAGKTTTLLTVIGDIKPFAGEILYKGQSIVGVKTHKLTAQGIALVPEGRHLFGKLSVEDNLLMGAYLEKDKQKMKNKLQEIYKLFPRVQERSKQIANTLSGGEQQMVAIARGLMCSPQLLILDEPSLGIMPKLVKEIFQFVQDVAKLGITIIIVEQNAKDTLAFADYAYVIQNGETVISGTGKELLSDEKVKKAYLGG